MTDLALPKGRGLGWIPDPKKAKGEKPDYDAAEVLGTDPIPLRADNSDLSIILNQGGAPSCVAHAAMQIIRMEHVAEGHADAPLGSRLWGWMFSRAMHGAISVWGGTYGRTMFEALNRMGFPQERWWPYKFDLVDGVERWRAMPSGRAFRFAQDQKAPVIYRRIQEAGYDRVDAVKRALARRKGVLWGTDVAWRFVRGEYGPDDAADPPGAGEDLAGGHCMALDQYEGDLFGGPQTYGLDYWLRGRYRVTADYIAAACSRDFWIVEQVPIFSELEVPT